MEKKIPLQTPLILLIMTLILAQFPASAEPIQEDTPSGGTVEAINPNISIFHATLVDGTAIGAYAINGPPHPPLEYEEERAASLVQSPSRNTLTNFPSYNWVFGCSAVSGAIIAAYYDRNGYPNIYTGPTNGGEMPITDTSWLTWTDSEEVEYPNNPLVASHYGVDGRMGYGSIDNYWVSYNSTDDDPYITNEWPEHIWETAIGDFMKTSQSTYDNVDGSTWFWDFYSGTKLTCSAMESLYDPEVSDYISNYDGTYGRKLFYEARGYTVGECYNQTTDNNYEGGFSLEDFKAEIDAGHPVFLSLRNDFTGEGHSIVGFGYSGDTIYIRDTWDSDPNHIYSMSWGGSYAGMALKSVRIVHPEPIVTPPDATTNVLASDGFFTDKVWVTWQTSDGATSYEVYRNMSDTLVGAQKIASNHPNNHYDDITAAPGNLYYYWVKACISSSCSEFSLSDPGYRAFTPPTGITATDGAFTDKVQVSWEPLMGATYYRIFRNVSNSPSVEDELGTIAFPPYDDSTATLGTSYYYWVMACNSLHCSDFSDYDTGYIASIINTPSAPTGVSASDGTFKEKVIITWPAVIGASRYEIYRNDNNTHIDEKLLTNSHTTNLYDDTNAEVGTTYYYWVKACNSAGCSTYSKYDSGYRAIEIPTVPEKVSASDGTYDDKVRVSWDESDRATYYEVYRNTINTNPAVLLEDNQNLPPYDDTSAVTGIIYYYWIKACNSSGCSDYSSYDRGFRSTVIPPRPTDLLASDGTYTDKVQISWVGSNYAEFYKLFRNTSDSFEEKDQIGGNIISSIYNDTSAEPDIKYYYSVKACRAAGCSNYSDSDIGWRDIETPTNQIYLPLIMSSSSAILDSSKNEVLKLNFFFRAELP